MPSDQLQAPRARRLRLFSLICLLTLIVPTLVAFLAVGTLTHGFVGSTSWIAVARPVGIAVGLAASVLIFFAARMRGDQSAAGRFVGAVFCGVFVNLFFEFTIPSLHAAVFGTEMEQLRVVRKEIDNKSCRGGMSFKGDSLLGGVCGWSAPPGTELVLQGRGSSLGLFPEAVSLRAN